MGVEGSPERGSQGVLHLSRHTAEGLGIGGLVVADPHDVFLDLHPNLFFLIFFWKKKSGELIHQGLRGVGSGGTLGSRPVADLLEYGDQLTDGLVHLLGNLDLHMAHILAGFELIAAEHGNELPVEPLGFLQKMEVFRTGRKVGTAVVLHRVEEILYLREVEESSKDIGCGIQQLVGFVDDTEVARQQAALGGMFGSGLLCSQEQVVVGDLEVEVIGLGGGFQEPGIFALLGTGAVIAGAFDTDPCFDIGVQRDRVQIQGSVHQIQSLHPVDGFAVLMRKKGNGVQVFPIPSETEIVIPTLSQYRSQGLLDKAEVHEHCRQSREFLFRDRLLKLDAGGGDGHRISHEAVGLVKELGKEASDQVCHGLAGSDLRFAEGHFSIVQAVEDG